MNTVESVIQEKEKKVKDGEQSLEMLKAQYESICKLVNEMDERCQVLAKKVNTRKNKILSLFVDPADNKELRKLLDKFGVYKQMAESTRDSILDLQNMLDNENDQLLDLYEIRKRNADADLCR